MTQYPIHSHYSGTELTSSYAILLMSRARLGSGKYQLYKSLVLTRPVIELLISFPRGLRSTDSISVPSHIIYDKAEDENWVTVPVWLISCYSTCQGPGGNWMT